MVLATRLLYELAARPQDLTKIAYCDILTLEDGVSLVKWHSQKNNTDRMGYISMLTLDLIIKRQHDYPKTLLIFT
jgi:hypothetical protein